MGEPLRSKENAHTLKRLFHNSRTKSRNGKGDLEKLHQVKEREKWSGIAAPLRDFSRTAAPSEGRGKMIWRSRTKWRKGKDGLEKLYQVKEKERWSRTAAPSEGRGKTIWRSHTRWRKKEKWSGIAVPLRDFSTIVVPSEGREKVIWRSRTKWRKEKGDLERLHPWEIFLE